MLVIFCDFAELFICNNVVLLCNTYNTCILTRVILMYYTIFIVLVPYSLDVFISSSSLLFFSVQNLHVTLPHSLLLFTLPLA